MHELNCNPAIVVTYTIFQEMKESVQLTRDRSDHFINEVSEVESELHHSWHILLTLAFQIRSVPRKRAKLDYQLTICLVRINKSASEEISKVHK